MYEASCLDGRGLIGSLRGIVGICPIGDARFGSAPGQPGETDRSGDCQWSVEPAGSESVEQSAGTYQQDGRQGEVRRRGDKKRAQENSKIARPCLAPYRSAEARCSATITARCNTLAGAGRSSIAVLPTDISAFALGIVL